MILQRLASALRRQDWFQVIIEVLIVVIGIFLGLQVQAWYDDSQLIAEERVYLTKLHDELGVILERSTIRYEIRTENLKLLNETINILSNKLSLEPLGNTHCRAIIRSSNFQRGVGKLSTVTDIQNNDRSAVFQNEKITDILSDYIRLHERWDNLTETNRYRSSVIEKTFPETIQLKGISDIAETRFLRQTYTCNFEMMQQNEAFKNALAANAESYIAYVAFTRFQHDSLLALHNEIDAELGIIHEGETP